MGLKNRRFLSVPASFSHLKQGQGMGDSPNSGLEGCQGWPPKRTAGHQACWVDIEPGIKKLVDDAAAAADAKTTFGYT